jgi:hypothetical protein
MVPLSLLLSGCGPGGPETYQVTGSVTFDGQPVSNGEIVFFDTDPSVGPDAGQVDQGKFNFLAKAGSKRVEIRASRPVPGMTDMSGQPLTDNFIPAKYNDATTLTATVTADSPNRFEFDLANTP